MGSNGRKDERRNRLEALDGFGECEATEARAGLLGAGLPFPLTPDFRRCVWKGCGRGPLLLLLLPKDP